MRQRCLHRRRCFASPSPAAPAVGDAMFDVWSESSSLTAGVACVEQPVISPSTTSGAKVSSSVRLAMPLQRVSSDVTFAWFDDDGCGDSDDMIWACALPGRHDGQQTRAKRMFFKFRQAVYKSGSGHQQGEHRMSH